MSVFFVFFSVTSLNTVDIVRKSLEKGRAKVNQDTASETV